MNWKDLVLLGLAAGIIFLANQQYDLKSMVEKQFEKIKLEPDTPSPPSSYIPTSKIWGDSITLTFPIDGKVYIDGEFMGETKNRRITIPVSKIPYREPRSPFIEYKNTIELYGMKGSNPMHVTWYIEHEKLIKSNWELQFQ
jgi:hypothetical protein